MTRIMTHKQKGLIISLLCAFCLLGGLVLTAAPVHAAGGTITIDYPTAVKADLTTEFRVYKVGSFENGNTLVWDSTLGDLAGKLPNVSESEFEKYGNKKMEKWSETLADAAYQLQAAIESPESTISIDPRTCTVGPATGKADVTGLQDNGLYLILGPREVSNSSGVMVGYEPVPALVTLFKGEATATIKPTMDRVTKYQVIKKWGDDDSEDADPIEEALRPSAIKVKLSYKDKDDTEFKTAESINVVTEDGTETRRSDDGLYDLTASENWSIVWEVKDREQQWMCKEVLQPIDESHYKTTQVKKVVANGSTLQFALQNKYDTEELELVKTMPTFIDHNVEGVEHHLATTIVFNIKGYIAEDGKDVKVFDRHESVLFEGTGTQSVPVKVPVNLTKLIVEEVYTGNYGAEESDTITLTPKDLKDGVYTAKFTNKWESTITPEGGIINQYSAPEGGPDFGSNDGGFEYVKKIITPDAPK